MKPSAAALVLLWVTGTAALVRGETGTTTAAPTSDLTDRLGVKYAAPAPQVKKYAAPTSIAIDPVDKSVVLLPRYEVHDDRLSFTENDMLTPQGRLAVAKKRTLSPLYQKTFGPISWLALLYFNPLALIGSKPNDTEAMVLYGQEEDIRRSREISDLRELGLLADEANNTKAFRTSDHRTPPGVK